MRPPQETSARVVGAPALSYARGPGALSSFVASCVLFPFIPSRTFLSFEFWKELHVDWGQRLLKEKDIMELVTALDGS